PSSAPPRVDADTLVLGIETSCDDTGAAVVTGDGRVLGEALASQVEIHERWGGVVPNLARDAHERAIDAVVAEALRRAGIDDPSRLSAVAVTVGPGLTMCLRVGVVAAQELSAKHALPIVPVHHMEAHALVARLAAGTTRCRFPFLALLVSGGHNQARSILSTLLILARGIGNYVILGSTLDDALGEAYDKTARLLGLNVGGGGGPALEALAREGDDASYKFPVPLRRRKDCDFSYAGLKTAVRLAIERDLGVGGEEDAATRRTRANIAASFQRVAVTHLTERTSRAVEWANDLLDDGETLSCVVVAGGVASNAVVRERLSEVASRCALPLVTPPPRWCVDNGVMVAWAGVERLALGLSEAPCTEAQVAASPSSANRRDVPTFPRWPLGERDDRATGHVKSAKTARIAAPLT
ncbi:uncharacterized protein MICPUCDRAFT_2716, partial [Micromonas pusilla CCMP1545]